MIIGVGIDTIEIDRIEQSLKKLGSKLLDRLSHPEELKLAPALKSRRAAEYWAARFAAKEAFAKAFGTGIGKTVPLNSVGVSKTRSGQPTLAFALPLERNLRRHGVTSSHISITHTAHYASAVVILEGRSQGNRK